MNNFVYSAPTAVYFGKGEEERVGKLIKDLGVKMVLIHYGTNSAKQSGLIDRILKITRGIRREVNQPDLDRFTGGERLHLANAKGQSFVIDG